MLAGSGSWAHPRVGGEDATVMSGELPLVGSPPRRRGRHQLTTADAGASSRYEYTRSNASLLDDAAQQNSIPAAVSRCVPYCSVSV